MLTVRTSENTVITSFRLISERQDFSSVRTAENTVRARARIQFEFKSCEEINKSNEGPDFQRTVRCTETSEIYPLVLLNFYFMVASAQKNFRLKYINV